MFCTYMYLRADATPYYVGKGTEERPFYEHRRVKRPAEDSRILIQFWSSEAEAFEMEKFYIRLFGRKDNGTGILRNRTDGGEGFSGMIFSAEHKQHLSTSAKRKVGPRNPAFGRKREDFSSFMSSYWTAEKKEAHRKALNGVGFSTPASRISGGRAASHKRWHIKRNIVKQDCIFCSQGVVAL